MVKSKGFPFYKILKNEDAPPYYFRNGDRGCLVAADGLGGAGSFVHEFSPKEYKDIEKRVKRAAFPEFFGRPRIEEEQSDADRIFGQWVDKLFDPMLDKDPDTSALWGSRVVISRFSKLVKDNFDRELASESFRQQIIEYIYEGMLSIQREFKLETGKIKGQLVLPTTLGCSKYSV